MKGILWDTAVKGREEKGMTHFLTWGLCDFSLHQGQACQSYKEEAGEVQEGDVLLRPVLPHLNASL